MSGIGVEDFVLMKDLTSEERLLFQTEMAARQKNPTTGLLLCLFLGGVGAHRFYLGETGLGVLYLCLCWTLVPALVSLVEDFMIMRRVRDYNHRTALEIASKIRAMRPSE